MWYTTKFHKLTSGRKKKKYIGLIKEWINILGPEAGNVACGQLPGCRDQLWFQQLTSTTFVMQHQKNMVLQTDYPCCSSSSEKHTQKVCNSPRLPP